MKRILLAGSDDRVSVSSPAMTVPVVVEIPLAAAPGTVLQAGEPAAASYDPERRILSVALAANTQVWLTVERRAPNR